CSFGRLPSPAPGTFAEAVTGPPAPGCSCPHGRPWRKLMSFRTGTETGRDASRDWPPPAGDPAARAYGGAGMMSVPIWSRLRAGSPAPGRPRTHAPSRQPTSRSLRVEVLEDPLLPSGSDMGGLGPPLVPDKASAEPTEAGRAPACDPGLGALVPTVPAATAPASGGRAGSDPSKAPDLSTVQPLRTDPIAQPLNIRDAQAQPDFPSRLG